VLEACEENSYRGGGDLQLLIVETGDTTFLTTFSAESASSSVLSFSGSLFWHATYRGRGGGADGFGFRYARPQAAGEEGSSLITNDRIAALHRSRSSPASS